MSLTLRTSFTLGLVAIGVVVAAAGLGIRWLSKAALFHHLERDHLGEAMQAARSLDLVQEGGRSAGRVDKAELLQHVQKARALARRADIALFAVEQRAFELIGFGEILSLPQDVIAATGRIEAARVADPGMLLTPGLAARIGPDLGLMKAASDRFGPPVAEATAFIRTTAIVLDAVALSVLLVVFQRLRPATLAPGGRVAAAAKEIAALIGDTVTKVEGGAREVTTAGEQISRAVATVEQVSTLTTEVALALGGQQQSIVRIDGAMRELGDATRQNAALAGQSAAAAASVRGQSSALVEAVGRFQLA